MRVYRTVSEIRNYLDGKQSIGFVPTMGALHDGHLSLLRKARNENEVTVCSVFVNPTQFNDPEDFKNYPRSVADDLKALEETGCDLVFLPEVGVVFPEPDTRNYDLGPIAEVLEGEKRPGHFNGVASVVKRLLEITKPQRAYFGLKDYQQFLVVKHMAKMFDLGVEVVGCDTVREDSGLAMSSRNERLDAEDRALAGELYQSLRLVAEESAGKSSAELEAIGKGHLSKFPRIQIEYFSVVDPQNLRTPAIDDGSAPRRALVAAKIGEVRLIDNMEV